MSKKDTDKRLKNLDELKFDSIGDEYIYLFETLSQNNFSDFLKDENISIEYLRELYTDLLKNNNLDVKYKDSKRYWFKEQEVAIVEYINTHDHIKKNEIFNKNLHKPLGKLIENIIFTYKLFRSDSNIKDIQHECLSFLITKIEKFNPKTGAQAFSYLGTIAKHYLMGEQRNSYKFTKTNVDIDENIDEASEKLEYKYDLEGGSAVDINFEMFQEIIENLEKDIVNSQNKIPLNDVKVAEAIVYLFRTHHIWEYYNKNKIYFFFKERTGLQTKEITNSLLKLKKYYKNLKSSYLKKNK